MKLKLLGLGLMCWGALAFPVEAAPFSQPWQRSMAKCMAHFGGSDTAAATCDQVLQSYLEYRRCQRRYGACFEDGSPVSAPDPCPPKQRRPYNNPYAQCRVW